MPEPRLSPAAAATPRTDLGAAWRDAAGAGLRYYGQLGRLTLRLAEELVPALGELRPALRLAPEEPAAARADAPVPAAAPAAQTIVIEATAGRSGLGVFMVENTTASQVSAPVGVSAFADAEGRVVQPKVRFSPEVVTLDPGDQVLVQVAATVDGTLEPGVRYRAEISVPRLSGATIPIVVRRRPPASRAKTAAR